LKAIFCEIKAVLKQIESTLSLTHTWVHEIGKRGIDKVSE
jgi:hypothetical protein